MDVVGAKILVMVLTSVIPILLSLLPLWFKSYLVPSKNSKSYWRPVLTSVLLCFGGGVLLATSLVHLLPEVWLNLGIIVATLDIYFSSQIAENLAVLETGIEPLAEILLCCGFFLIYFVEDLVYICCGNLDYSESTEEIVMTECVNLSPYFQF